MPYQLTAKFDVPSPDWLYLQREDEGPFVIQFVESRFRGEVRIEPSLDGPKTTHKDEKTTLYIAKGFIVSVTGEERDAPPDVIVNEKGHRNGADRANWLEVRREEYRQVAVLVSNRVLSYFKYRLNNPSLHPLSIGPEYINTDAFENPSWFGPDGNELDSFSVNVVTHFIDPVENGLFQLQPLTKEREPEIASAIANGVAVSAAQEFVSDAQRSIRERNYRRAALELAVACETGIKRAIFDESTPAGAAYAYLENKKKVEVEILELIGAASLEAFNESFKDSYPSDYENLENLFRCRNKIAHRAKAQYRNRAGKMKDLDRETMDAWWRSAQELFTWLKAKTGRMP